MRTRLLSEYDCQQYYCLHIMQSRILVASKAGKSHHHNNNASPTKTSSIINTTATTTNAAVDALKASKSSLSSSKSHSKQPPPSSPTKAVTTSANAYSHNINGSSGGSAFYHTEADKENIRSPIMVSAIPTRLNPSSTAVNEPTMAQLLAQSPAHNHIRQATEPTAGAAANGAGNAANIGLASWRKGQGFKAWESELLKSQDVRRKADVAQLCK